MLARQDPGRRRIDTVHPGSSELRQEPIKSL